MGFFRVNQAAVATLLLAALVSAGVAAHGHHCDPIAEAHGHTHLATYAGGHDHAVPATHIEEATRIELPPCPACLYQQRQRVAGSLAVALGGVGQDSWGVELDRGGPIVAGTSRLPAARAPPSA